MGTGAETERKWKSVMGITWRKRRRGRGRRGGGGGRLERDHGEDQDPG